MRTRTITPPLLMLGAWLLSACAAPGGGQAEAPTAIVDAPGAAKMATAEEAAAAPAEASAVSETTTYASAAFGIELAYPTNWYLQDTGEGILLTSFDPANPPHKLEWTSSTASLEFRLAAYDLRAAAFEAGIQVARTDAVSQQLEITSEDRFTMAGEPAARLGLVSGSGGIIQRVLTHVAGRDLQIDVQGNYEIARPVLASVRPLEADPAPAATQAPVASVPPPVVPYINAEVGYRLGLPGDWQIDESGMSAGLNKEVIFSPPGAVGSGVIYLSISIDPRTLQQVIDLYAQNVRDAAREDVIFNGHPGVRYHYSYRDETYVPLGGRLFLILTDRPLDSTVQSILLTIQFEDRGGIRDIRMEDNGSTMDVNVGDVLSLDLDAGYDWSPAVSDYSVLAEEQGGFRAVMPGSATLTAVGNPLCYTASPPCLAPSVLFTLGVNVH